MARVKIFIGPGLSRRRFSVKLNHVRILHAAAPKNVERRPDRQVNSPLPQARDFRQVRQRIRSARIRRGNR